MATQVFISYSHRDDEFVLKLANDLERLGIQVWIDRGDIRVGTVWRQSIENAIKNCTAFILVVSPDAVVSQYVTREVSLAEAYHKSIFPLLYRKTEIPKVLASQLEPYQYLNFGQGSYDQHFTDLVAGLSSIRSGLPPVSENEQKRIQNRRYELLGAPSKISWRTVFAKIPGWTIAWVIGWTLYWPITLLLAGLLAGLLIYLEKVFPGLENNLLFLWITSGPALFGAGIVSVIASTPVDLLIVGMLLGAVVGGLLVGTISTLALRHNASSIRWKHMAISIRSWCQIGPPVSFLILDLVCAGSYYYVFNTLVQQQSKCAGFDLGCILGEALGAAIIGVFAMGIVSLIFGSLALLITFLGIGLLTGLFAVRRIRRLEPGITRRQSMWVMLGWGIGSVLAPAAAVFYGWLRLYS